jgi:universal stress protein A
MQSMKRILCPTDFSESSAKAIAFAEKLAEATGAEFVLFHAFDLPATWTISGQEHPRDPRIEKQLDEVLSNSPIQSRVQRLLHAGEPGEVICWVAQEHQCDLIVMGTHGRTGIKHLLFGSIAEYVLEHARCPVLTVRNRLADEMPLSRPVNMPVMAPRFM